MLHSHTAVAWVVQSLFSLCLFISSIVLAFLSMSHNFISFVSGPFKYAVHVFFSTVELSCFPFLKATFWVPYRAKFCEQKIINTGAKYSSGPCS